MDARRINGIFFVDCLARPLKAGRAGQLILDATDRVAVRSVDIGRGADIVGAEAQDHSERAIRGTGPAAAPLTNVGDAAVSAVPAAPRRIGKVAIRYTERIRLLVPI